MIGSRITVETLLNQRPTPGLLVKIRLRMRRKNDFSMLFGPSDPSGRIIVSWSEIQSECDAEQSVAIMDYGSLQEDFTRDIELMPVSLAGVEAALAAFEMFKSAGTFRGGYEAALRTARATLAAAQNATLGIAVVQDDLSAPHRFV